MLSKIHMQDDDIVAVSLDGFVTNNPDSVAKILTSRKRKRVQYMTRGTAKAMARIFGREDYHNLAASEALRLTAL